MKTPKGSKFFLPRGYSKYDSELLNVTVFDATKMMVVKSKSRAKSTRKKRSKTELIDNMATAFPASKRRLMAN